MFRSNRTYWRSLDILAKASIRKRVGINSNRLLFLSLVSAYDRDTWKTIDERRMGTRQAYRNSETKLLSYQDAIIMHAPDADRTVKLKGTDLQYLGDNTIDAKSTLNRQRNSLKQMRRISGNLSLFLFFSRKRRNLDLQDTCVRKSPGIHFVHARGFRGNPIVTWWMKQGCGCTRKHKCCDVLHRRPDHCNLKGRRNMMGHALRWRLIKQTRFTVRRRLINAIIIMRGTRNFYSMEIFILKTNNNASLTYSDIARRY